MLQNCRIAIISAFNEKFQPVFALCAFFQGNLEFGDKVRTTMSMECLPDIGADARSRADELIGENAFSF